LNGGGRGSACRTIANRWTYRPKAKSPPPSLFGRS